MPWGLVPYCQLDDQKENNPSIGLGAFSNLCFSLNLDWSLHLRCAEWLSDATLLVAGTRYIRQQRLSATPNWAWQRDEGESRWRQGGMQLVEIFRNLPLISREQKTVLSSSGLYQ